MTTLLPVFSEFLLSLWAGCCLFSFGSIGLPDYARIFPSYQGYSLVVICGLHVGVASLVAEKGL